jgi:low temperature requirement protein LtrA
MGHFPVIFGIVLYAVAAEEVVAHPSEPLTTAGRWIFALAVILITFGLIGAVRRAGGPWLWERAVAAVIVVAATLFVEVGGWAVVLGFVAAMAIGMLAEDRRLAGVTGPALAE